MQEESAEKQRLSKSSGDWNQGHFDAFDHQHLLQQLGRTQVREAGGYSPCSVLVNVIKNCTCFIEFCMCVHGAVARWSLKFFSD